MRHDADGLFYASAGPIAAMLLGFLLIPLRENVASSNLAFAFLALTIATAELGGPRAAVVTALTSALSLDFFLTKPYLKLAIVDKQDIIAFFGLAACGLVAAGFSTRRQRRIASVRHDRSRLMLLRAALRRLEDGGPPEFVLAQVLEEARQVLPVTALVARDDQGRVVAASEGGQKLPVPLQILRLDTLLPVDSPERVVTHTDVAIPSEGGRLPLVVRNRRVGWLDVQGSGTPADEEARRTLSDVARLASVWLAWGARGSADSGSERA